MRKTMPIIALVGMCTLFIVGLVLIFSAPSIGQNVGDAAVINNGGGMDTDRYIRIVDSTTDSYQMGGFVISLVGGLGLLTSGYALHKER